MRFAARLCPDPLRDLTALPRLFSWFQGASSGQEIYKKREVKRKREKREKRKKGGRRKGRECALVVGDSRP